MRLFKITTCILLIFSSITAQAQYYNDGQDPFSTRWMEYRNDCYRLLYPDVNMVEARRVATVLDTAYTALHYGFTRRAMRLPVILHTQNLRSNGVVTWAPRRAELITAPPTETFAVPWLKQLTVHEYRHVVQMSNLNRSVIKAAGVLLGEQAVGASAGFLPQWFLEGDAVLAETSMAAYGRGLQPEFTLAYRALLADRGTGQFSLDKWFCGSMRDVLPNHYYYGYQMVNAGYKRYGADMWERVLDYTARHPYLVFPRQIAVRKYFGTSSGQLFRETFEALKAQWDSLPPVVETMRIVPTPTDSYTTYTHPLAIDGRIVAHKNDLTRGDRLVTVDPQSGRERRLARTGAMSSRPAVVEGELYWTEYQASTFWEQRNRSVVRHMPADGSRRTRTLHVPGNLFYVTPCDGRFAAVEYNPAEGYTIVIFNADFQEMNHIPIPSGTTVHGLAWDGHSHTLAAIFLGERGMNLERILPERRTTEPITPPDFVTINHLTAGGGQLFFNSIRSGRDESHAYNLLEQKEYRLTTSQFGSVMPSVDAAGETLVQTSYRRGGYLLSTQRMEETMPQSVAGPVNLFNPAPVDLGLPVLDTMRLYPVADARELPSRRYRRGGHLFKLHSWAPVSFDALDLANNRNLDFQMGATIITQSELSNTEGYLSYGRIKGHDWWRGGLRLLSMAPKIEINAEYGGGRRGVARPNADTPLPTGWDKDYFSAEARIYLPVNLSSGATVRSLTPSLSLMHQNTMFYLPETGGFTSGYQQSQVSLSYSQTARMAVRDLVPRQGFGVQAAWIAAPFDSHFGSVLSLYGNVYLPGVAQNHGLRLRGAWQTQSTAVYQFTSSALLPRGVTPPPASKEQGTVLADYYFPVAYPDGGINGLLYIKRISADLFGGIARYRIFTGNDWRQVHSYGGELRFDFVPLRLAGLDCTFRAAVYQVSGEDGVNASFGLTFNL